MKINLASLLLIFIGLADQVVGQDSLIYFEEIKYHSDFERTSFENFFKKNNENYLALFLATRSSVSDDDFAAYEKIYFNNVSDIKQVKLSKKNVEKRIKTIHAEVHERFLKKYEAQNTMKSVFVNGSYNCVSASALYSMVFEELQIPYTIKEKPSHVYVVAYPDGESILVESTDPSSGVISYSENFKKEYINQLASAKIIDQNQMSTSSIDHLFDEYFFSDENITLKQLIGLQYINEALYLFELKDMVSALKMLEKAYFFFPEEKLKALLLVTNADILATSNYEDLSLADNFVKLSRFREFDINSNTMASEFARISDIHLNNRNDTLLFDQFYNRIVTGLENEEMKNEISYLYHYERGRILYNQGFYSKSLVFFENAYKIKPNNIDISRVFVNNIILKLGNESDINLTTESLEKFKTRIPDLMENNVFKSYLVNNYLIQFGQSYELRNEKKGLQYRQLFEQNYNKELTVNKSNVGRAYSMAAVYYFRKGYSNKARSILKSGLEFAPGNHELLNRQRLIR